jgi:hypothetical protein
MQIQFDPFAFTVAVVAALIAWRAHFLAKTAPDLARRREIRDQIREQLEGLRRAAEDVSPVLQMGKPLTAPPAGFGSSLEKLAALAPRVPEENRLGLIEAKLHGLEAAWDMAHSNEQMSAYTKQDVADWQERVAVAQSGGDAKAIGLAREALDKALTDQEKYRRVEEASRTRLREVLKDSLSETKSYIGWLDSIDTGKIKA